MEAPRWVATVVRAAAPPRRPPRPPARQDANSGKLYFFHEGTRETTWTKPADFIE
jgi:hypothetical protein